MTPAPLSVVVACVLGLLCAPAQAGRISIATGDYPPFTDAAAPDGGLVNAVVAAIAEAAGLQAAFDYMPWARALEVTRQGDYAATSFWYQSDERAADFIHVGPIIEDRLVLFHLRDTVVPDWTVLTDLAGLRIGAVTGYTYTADFWDLAEAGALTVDVAHSDLANFRKMLTGRIDVYPMSLAAGITLLETRFSPEERARITTHPVPLSETQGYLLVSRAWPGAEGIAEALQTALDAHLEDQLADAGQDR